MANRVVDKKQALLTRKETLLKELQYYEKRIEELRNKKSNSSFYDDESSESEQESNFDIGPSITELKLQQSMLKTCLHATQELTSVQVLQSEVNILVEDPVYEGEPPVTEEGVWREVTVECRVDLVPFSMSFNTHQPNRLFGSPSYRNLQVAAVKAAHEKELSKSVLSTVTTPSDAIEVFRSYAKAHRSRRATLARLAEAYADALHMEPLPEGGYMLKCANLLEVSWTLQNKWSPIAPFHHKMKFDVEYMDESYIKIITQAHRQLSDPTIETDERTLLLSKIIKTCLQAQKPTQELHESFDSDSLKEKRQTLEDKEEQIKATDNEMMAPPKYPPKKIKAKGKENVNTDKKRPSNIEDDGNAKRAKLDSNDKIANTKNKVSSKAKDDAKAKKAYPELDKADNTSKSTINKASNNDKNKKSNAQLDKNDNTSKSTVNKASNDDRNKKSSNLLDKNDNSSKNSKVTNNDNNAKTKKVNSPIDKVDQSNDKSKHTDKLSKAVDNNTKVKHTVTDKINKNENTNKAMNKDDGANSKGNTKKDGKALSDSKKSNNIASEKNINKKQVEENTESNNLAASTKNDKRKQLDGKTVSSNVASSKNDNKNQLKDNTDAKNVVSSKIGKNKPLQGNTASNDVASSKNDNIKSTESNSNKVKKVATVKNSDLKRRDNENIGKDPKSTDIIKKLKSTENISKQAKQINKEIVNTNIQSKNIIESMKKSLNKDKNVKQINLAERFNKNKVTTIKNKVTTIKNKATTIKNREQQNVLFKKSLNSNNVKTSKIPQKRLSTDNFKKNPLRISPRKPQSNSNSVNDSSKTSIRSMQKVVTNIPRLLKKPTAKPKTMV